MIAADIADGVRENREAGEWVVIFSPVSASAILEEGVPRLAVGLTSPTGPMAAPARALLSPAQVREFSRDRERVLVVVSFDDGVTMLRMPRDAAEWGAS